uniref:uncharacterized protein LOC105350822 n=1 Tax=Fragaria vesca subsp. vesca TaxID=101020 RepID=UPI0005C87B0E|nr:PREDICTED: uncharacterized protein LOC105350822 [Fragaria vesca subsp. vesca]
MELKQVGKSTSSSGEKDETNSNSVWSIIWGLSVPNKVKLFLWRACHAFLPCVERLFKRKVCSSDICGRCGGASESVLHSLWDCRIAQKVWKCTWNDTMHGKEGLKPDILFHRCKEWKSELAQTQSTNKPITGIVVKEVVRTPQLNGRVGVGVVVLNPEHGLLGALLVLLPLSLNPKATEALALWYGIEYGKKLGVSNVDIRGDALNVLNGLKTCGWDFSEIRGVLDAVRLIMTDFEIVSWRHVKKRFNAVAHELARKALSLAQGWFCKEQGPEWLLQLIVDSNV